MLPGATTATAGIDNLAKYMATSMTEAADPASDTQWARRPASRRSRCRGPAHPACVQPSVLGHSARRAGRVLALDRVPRPACTRGWQAWEDNQTTRSRSKKHTHRPWGIVRMLTSEDRPAASEAAGLESLMECPAARAADLGR